MTPRWRDGNRITLLNSGHEYMPALCAAFDLARVEIFLETYIYAHDEAASRVTAALCAAAGRGVRVHLLVDGFGARDLPEQTRAALQQAGVRLLVYRKPVLWRPVRGLRRMHRKLAVIDHRIAFAGGINIIDDWNTPDEVPPRFDYAIRIEGPLAADVRASTRHLWFTTALAALKPRETKARDTKALDTKALELSLPTVAGTQRAALLVRDNLLHRTEIEDAYLQAINAAQQSILLANSYFLPSARFFRALRAAARRGVRVTILLQGPTDHPLLKVATQFLYRRLIGAGIEVVEYQKSFLHAKVGVIDAHWATVGSSNIDPFSLMLAREANVVIDDAVFAGQLRGALEAAMAAGGTRIGADAVQRTPLPTRVAQWFAYRFARISVDLVTPAGGRRLF